MGESSVSLEIIQSNDLYAAYRSLGAADAGLEAIASGRLTKKECVVQAKRTLALMKKFEAEKDRREGGREYL